MSPDPCARADPGVARRRPPPYAPCGRGNGVRLDLDGPAGRLESLYEAPPEPRFCAAVLHPHPLLGGTMDNHATYRLAKAVRAAGGAALRINFRGVGRSAGAYDGGRGEREDARAALAWLGAHHPGLPRLTCGFSFGSWMALEAGCADPAVSGVLCAGLALALREVATDVARACPKPVAVVQAERDEFGSPAEVEAALRGAAGPRRVHVVERASHLFTEALPALEAEAAAALGWILRGAP